MYDDEDWTDRDAGDYDPEFDQAVRLEVAVRHAEEDRLEADRCEADPEYAAEAQMRAMGA